MISEHIDHAGTTILVFALGLVFANLNTHLMQSLSSTDVIFVINLCAWRH